MSQRMLWLKALHVIGVISWMAGLLYVYRLFVYHAQETEEVVKQRFIVMERRLLNAITTPAGLVALVTGTGMLAMTRYYLSQPYMWAKLTMVVGMLVMHGAALHYRRLLVANSKAKPHQFFRVMNEIPTLLMIGIVIMIIVRPWATP